MQISVEISHRHICDGKTSLIARIIKTENPPVHSQQCHSVGHLHFVVHVLRVLLLRQRQVAVVVKCCRHFVAAAIHLPAVAVVEEFELVEELFWLEYHVMVP